ncbi:PREDICTED: cytosolic carboxypeptidase 2-like [Acropora digitifera]|uniref:cytosolic carboxypeptidase 2-like n=1 Tax=Acropora digitifera TaxID=70779 RepID=UPI00077A8616|nr:PREDICTED: cytosolic carboxypeptidase 2-like [Acropora digitifera]
MAFSPPAVDCKQCFLSGLRFSDKEARTTQLVFTYQGGKKVQKLREPRNLYSFCLERSQQSLPRWPVQLKVLPVHPKHIHYVPKKPEPFFKPTKTLNESCLPKLAYDEGTVVYDNEPGPDKYFLRSCVGGAQVSSKPFYHLTSPDDCTLLFESRFECGNLLRAVKVDNNEYQLWLRNDLYTNKHTQWYYFRVQNTRPSIRYKFTIMNLLKSGSLYNEGMRPLFYSEMDATKKKIGWVRKGDDIKYYRNAIKREDTTKDKYHYSLTWTCEFPNEKDTYYFAHCYPYTYSDLQEYLLNMRSDPVQSRICKQRVLCQTLAGNLVYVLTVTNPSRRPADAEAKQNVVVTARVHPGETNSSWMMKGLLDYLTSNAPDAKLLRDTFIFKIVPMLNPDGVIIGNYRCSLAGRDLNRNYKTVLKDSFPPIWHVTNMARKLLEERDITLYCDLHGHSRKQNVFIYGCENRFDPLKRLRERVFPVMISKNAPTQATFCGSSLGKRAGNHFNTADFESMGYHLCDTLLDYCDPDNLKATFCGSSLGKRAGNHFNTADFESMGYHLCDTLLDYCDPDNLKYVSILRELELTMKAEILAGMRRKGTAAANLSEADIDLDTNYPSDIESSTGGSDSSVSDGLPMHIIYAAEGLKIGPRKKKKLKTRKERNKRRAKAMKIKDVILANVARKAEQDPPAEVKLVYQKRTKRSAQPSQSARMKLGAQCRKNDESRSWTPVSPQEGLRVEGARCRVIKDRLCNISKHHHEASVGQWSSASPLDQAHGFDLSDAEGNFTVSYLAKNQEGTNDFSSVLPRSRSVQRTSSALALARKITMANNRRKKAEADAQEAGLQSPSSFIPRSPVQQYPYFPWRQKGDCLSSTKARLYESKPLKEQGIRKSLSQISLDERKAKKASRKNFTWKRDVSGTTAEVKSLKTTHDSKVNKVEANELESKRGSQGVKNSQATVTSQSRGEAKPTQHQSLVGPRSMTKYTDNGEKPFDSIPFDLDPSTTSYRLNHTSLPKSNSTLNDSPSVVSHGNTSLISGRQSPVYLAVPVDRPPMKVKLKTRAFEQDMADIATINKLRSKLTNADHLGTLITHPAEKAGPCSSSSSRDDGPMSNENISYPSPSWRNKSDSSCVAMETGSTIPWTDDSINLAGLVTENHFLKYQCPDVSPEIHIWNGHNAMIWCCIEGFCS